MICEQQKSAIKEYKKLLDINAQKLAEIEQTKLSQLYMLAEKKKQVLESTAHSLVRNLTDLDKDVK